MRERVVACNKMLVFHYNLFEIRSSRIESRNERQNLFFFFDVLGLFCKAVSRDSKRTSARIVSTSSRGQPRSVRRV